MWNLSAEAIITPRSFSKSTLSSKWPFMLYFFLGFDFPMWRHLHFDVLKGRLHLSDHVARLLRSSCSDEWELVISLDIFVYLHRQQIVYTSWLLPLACHLWTIRIMLDPELNLVECHFLLSPILSVPLQYKPFVFCYEEMILSSVIPFLLSQTPPSWLPIVHAEPYRMLWQNRCRLRQPGRHYPIYHTRTLMQPEVVLRMSSGTNPCCSSANNSRNVNNFWSARSYFL